MSFRNRLTVFFIVLVILPMIVVAAVGFVLASDSEQGKSDARLSEAQRSASGLFREYQDRAEDAARVIAGGDALAPARTRLIDAQGDNAGVLTLSAIGAQPYAELVERVTGADVVIGSGNDLVVSTL